MAQTLPEYLAWRNDILENLDAKSNSELLACWPKGLSFPSDTEHGALAAWHKARLVWTGGSEEMRENSRKWLSDHGYKPTFAGLPH